MSRKGPKRFGYGIEPKLLVTMRESCLIGGHPMEQSEAAELVGVSRNTWCRWENGHRGMHQDYVRRWLEVSRPYRIWDPVMLSQPQEQLVSGVNFRRAPHPPGPAELALDCPVSDTTQLGPAPSDLLTVPDSSELERLDSETVSE